MPDVKSGLEGPGVESGPPSDDQILDATFAKAARGGVDTPTREEPDDTPAGRGNDARHYRDTPTTSRDHGQGRATLTPEGVRYFTESSEDSTDVESGLKFSESRERPEPVRSAEEIRAEARSRDPQAWDRAQRMRGEQHSAKLDAVADQAEIHALRLDRMRRAHEDGEVDEGSVFGAARSFAKNSPTAWEQYLSEQDELVYQEADAQGLTPEDDEYPTDEQMPSIVWGNAVRQANDQERAQAQLARSESMIAGITDRNMNTYIDALDASGLKPDTNDEQSVDGHNALREWIALSTGTDPDVLAQEDPARAAKQMRAAVAQLDAWDSDVRRHLFVKDIVRQEDGSVSGALRSGVDAQNDRLNEIADLLRVQNGGVPSGVPDAPPFDENFQAPVSKKQASDPKVSVGQFKRELVEGDEPYGGGFTRGGKKVSLSVAAFDKELYEAERRERIRASGLR